MGWVFTDEMRFYLHENETLLEGMKRTGHQTVRFECQRGYCGSCKMRITAKTGDIKTIGKPIAMLDDDEVLACCCQATGSICVTYAQKSDQEQLSLFEDKQTNSRTNVWLVI
ncbi:MULTISPECIES: 2Fe-2S iron-sulfur cluster-binding protein [unclassified Moraxella]|uniref:2Fe-2S iron-sulfur cluster-binding protein n=1 Tax=unclassified Moraxella TaxID=2685852 RepID=UPI00359CF63A